MCPISLELISQEMNIPCWVRVVSRRTLRGKARTLPQMMIWIRIFSDDDISSSELDLAPDSEISDDELEEYLSSWFIGSDGAYSQEVYEDERRHYEYLSNN